MRPTADNPRRSADRHRAAKRWPCVFLAVVLTTASLSVPDAVAAPAPAGPAEARDARSPLPTESRAAVGSRSASRAETLWIFDADFEDFTGDNAGWTTYDLSETLARINYWHKDTIRINGFTHLGDNTWWCGAYNSCWRQPRGYGNDWTCSLSRSFPEIAGSTDPGDPLFLEYDQRFAMENCYDYGYVDISTPGDTTWTTIVTVTNEGGCGGFEWPGLPKDWDSTWWPSPGHMLVDLSAYSGAEFQLRFRFESDASYSSQDQYDNSLHSMLDGAWQLDNITLWAETPGSTLIFLDDCELPGDNGWAHDDLPAMGQTGVVFSRMFEPDTHRGFACDPRTGWMMAAVDAVTGRMVDGQYSWLMSPPIDISGVSRLVGQWDAWIDAPEDARDIYNLYLASTDDEECVLDRATFVDEYPGWQYGGPFWGTWASNWDAFAGNDWLAIEWAVQNTQPPEPGADHMGGIFLARQRVGIPIYLDEPRWSFPPAKRFYDTFDAGLWMEAEVYIASDVGIASVDLVATNDGGATWDSYPLQREPLEKWEADVPANQMVPGVEILYYFTATDSAGGTSLFPADAPDDCFEFSVLPINASAEDRGILLVDKSAEAAPGDDRAYRHESEYYFREALDILGY